MAVAYWLLRIVMLISYHTYFGSVCSFVARSVAITIPPIFSSPTQTEEDGTAATAEPKEPTEELPDVLVENSTEEAEHGDDRYSNHMVQPQMLAQNTLHHGLPTAAVLTFETIQEDFQDEQETVTSKLLFQEEELGLVTEQEEDGEYVIHQEEERQMPATTQRDNSNNSNIANRKDDDSTTTIQGTDDVLPAASWRNVATEILQRHDKQPLRTVDEICDRQTEIWTRVIYTHQTGQIPFRTPSKLRNQVTLSKDTAAFQAHHEENSVKPLDNKSRNAIHDDDFGQYVIVEKHDIEGSEPTDNENENEDKEQALRKKQNAEHGEAAHNEPASIITDNLELIGQPEVNESRVPPLSPMKIDTFDFVQTEQEITFEETLEKVVEELRKLKLNGDSDDPFLSVSSNEGAFTKMDIVSSIFESGRQTLIAYSEDIVFDHMHMDQCGSSILSSNSMDTSISTITCAHYSSQMNEIETDYITPPPKPQLNDDPGTMMSEDDDSSIASCTSSRSPFHNSSRYSFSSHASSCSSDTDSIMTDLSDSLSMLSLDSDSPIKHQGTLTKAFKAFRITKARVREVGTNWCECATEGADAVVGKTCGGRAKMANMMVMSPTKSPKSLYARKSAKKTLASLPLLSRSTPRLPKMVMHSVAKVQLAWDILDGY
ncbi:hypothetical protein SEUCBS139899_009005 [Sporothrix eucalyptigena]